MVGVGATFRILGNGMGQGSETRVGEGSSGPGVRRVQQLLARLDGLGGVEFPSTQVSGAWGITPPGAPPEQVNATTKALRQFQTFLGIKEEDQIDFVAPDKSPEDKHELLFQLAKSAAVLLPVPYTYSGAAALDDFFETARNDLIDYAFNPGNPFRNKDRWVFGFPSRPYVIFTDIPPRPQHPGQVREIWFDGNNRALNCVSFANLVMSIWRTGGAHSAPYDAVLGSGGYEEIGSRYGIHFLSNIYSDNVFQLHSSDFDHNYEN